MTRKDVVVPANSVAPADLARALVKGNAPRTKLYLGDCRDVLPELEDESVHLVLTDPPYFLDRLDDRWDKERIEKSQGKAGVIGGMPTGMRFDPAQGRNLQEFMQPVAEELLRILKPGGFLLMFAAPRLYHRAAVAVEDAGFEIRDTYAWRFTKKAQFKAFTMDHFIQRKADWTKDQKEAAIASLDQRRTPQLRPQFEAIMCAQKPRNGTFVDNWLAHETGLIDARHTLKGRVPDTIMTVEKHVKTNGTNGHLTPKPLKLCKYLIRLFSKQGQTVLDPFLGSGTTCVAAQQTGRESIGIEISPDYMELARPRLRT